MGWNEGYQIMEHTVVALYNAGVLTAALLDQVMIPYKGTDCDAGGSEDVKAHDGLGVEEIICLVMEPDAYRDVIEHPVYWPASELPGWATNERAGDLFESIWRDRWGIY